MLKNISESGVSVLPAGGEQELRSTVNVDLPAGKKEWAFARTASWTAKGSLAVLDQGLFAGSNFLINLILARWLAPADYGAFAVAYSIFLLLGTLYSSLLTEPMLVYGPGKYLSRVHEYLGLLLRGHVAITVSLSAMLFAIALFLGRFHPDMGWAFAGVAMAAPCILLIWLTRSAFYIWSRPAWPATGGAAYCVGLVASVATLHSVGKLTPFTALAAMGSVSLLIGLLLVFVMKVRWTPIRSVADIRGVAADHWNYGRWVAPARAAGWAPTNIYFAIIPIWFGLSDSGVLKALLNFSMPVVHTLTALGVLILPTLVRERSKGGTQGLRASVLRFCGVAFLGTLIYGVTLWSFRDQALSLLYGKNYLQFSSLPFLLACLVPFGACVAEPFARALAAIERPDLMFRSSAVSAVVAIGLGVPLVAAYGLIGALAGVTLSNIVLGFMNYLYYKRASVANTRVTLADIRNGSPVPFIMPRKVRDLQKAVQQFLCLKNEPLFVKKLSEENAIPKAVCSIAPSNQVMRQLNKLGYTRQHSFVFLKREKHPYLGLPVGSSKLFSAGLRIYTPWRIRAKALKSIGTAIPWVGGWLPEKLLIASRDTLPLERIIADVTGEGNPVFSWLLNIRSHSSKVTLQVMRPDGQILGYIKMSLNEEAAKSLRNEASTLMELWAFPEMRRHIPQILYEGPWSTGYILFVSALQGSPAPLEFTSSHANFLKKLMAISPIERSGKSLVEEIFASWLQTKATLGPDWKDVGEIVLERAGKVLDGNVVQCGISHGDFVPENQFALNGRLLVFDWERSSQFHPLNWDIFHFHLEVAFLLRMKVEDVYAVPNSSVSYGSWLLYLLYSSCRLAGIELTQAQEIRIRQRRQLLSRELLRHKP